MQGDNEIPRDRWGRPLLPHPVTNEVQPYTRASTLSDAIENHFNLSLWKQRQVAVGLAGRADLIASVLAKQNDVQALNAIVSTAQEVAGSSASANTGTAIHAFTEYLDRGEPLPRGISDRILDSLKAYTVMLIDTGIEVKAIERFVGCQEVMSAGTFDRIVSWEGRNYIADIKTGFEAYKYGHSAAVQMAVYSRGVVYTHGKGWGSDLREVVNQNEALMIYLPAKGDAKCEIYSVDISTGWEMAKVASQVRDWWKEEMCQRLF